MRDKVSWFIRLSDVDRAGMTGIGECGPLPGLSPDAVPDFERVLEEALTKLSTSGPLRLKEILDTVPPGFPSIRFGLEMAWHDLNNGGKRIVFDNSFRHGVPIPINGLIWMGDLDFMMNQINQKIAQGFRCIKLKVGGLDFDRECDVLEYIRKRYFNHNIEIRLDANGAFKLDDALYKISELSKFNVHSIEQPIKAGQPDMEELCRKSAIPVAFDEELIGKELLSEKSSLLKAFKPQFIVLKPTLLGGFQASTEWIELAESMGIGWWITSALESNIGLNAICQYTASFRTAMPQGLGTGGIYENNIPSPLQVRDANISLSAEGGWDESGILT